MQLEDRVLERLNSIPAVNVVRALAAMESAAVYVAGDAIRNPFHADEKQPEIQSADRLLYALANRACGTSITFGHHGRYADS